MNCDYGCNNEATHRISNGKMCCSITYSMCPAVRERNSLGLKRCYNNNNIKPKFNEFDREKSILKKKDIAAEKLLNGTYTGNNDGIKKILLHLGVEYKCQHCGIEEWYGNKISLELDHIDGNNLNNSIDNLRLLCPNCHSITPTWRGKNINSGKTKVSDDTLLEAINNCKNIRQALISVGLTPKGGNYLRVKRLIELEK